MLHHRKLEEGNVDVQKDRVSRLREEHADVHLRFSDERMPWRGTFADPSMEYKSGEAVLLVEEKDVPLSMRQAAVTDNASFVAGLSRYFDLIWEHESTETDDVLGSELS